MVLPPFITPADLAAHTGFAERTLRAKAREIGACRELGKTMILLEGDVHLLMEALRPCPSNSTGVEKSGTIEAPLRGDDYGSLRARLTGKSRNGSRRRSKAAPGNVVSMDRARG